MIEYKLSLHKSSVEIDRKEILQSFDRVDYFNQVSLAKLDTHFIGQYTFPVISSCKDLYILYVHTEFETPIYPPFLATTCNKRSWKLSLNQ